MLDWLKEAARLIETERPLGDLSKADFVHRALVHILKGQHHMALQTQALNDAVAKLSADATTLATAVTALIAAHGDPAGQTAVDAAAAAVVSAAGAIETSTKAVNDALAPPAPNAV